MHKPASDKRDFTSVFMNIKELNFEDEKDYDNRERTHPHARSRPRSRSRYLIQYPGRVRARLEYGVFEIC
jgi:hypothetical protein